ncbi:uncharacterized protein [Miscanthus floridulus]|uniref:uncharacterized protein n=1 Tax=Miscanthus floridulus TaxID=154761 RepID=UPI00345B05F6
MPAASPSSSSSSSSICLTSSSSDSSTGATSSCGWRSSSRGVGGDDPLLRLAVLLLLLLSDPSTAPSASSYSWHVMKRNGDIASLFQKHAAKKMAAAAAATSNPDPIEPVVEEQIHERVVEEIGTGLDTFTVDGWKNWNIGEKALRKHMGSKAHIAAQERYIGFTNPKVAIDYNIEKWSDEDLRLYKKRLTYSLRCIKFLLHQGLAFHGHDESEESSNRGNFIELLKFLARNSEEVKKYVLDNALDDTTSLSLKDAIDALLVSHGLTMTQIRGQGYDGASNMKGDIKGLKTLIMQESPSAYYINCFAHQLQLVLVAVAKGNTDCETFFDQISILLNIVGVSCKCHDMLRNASLESVKKTLDCGEIKSRTGLHQEMGLPRPRDTRWGSHYKTVCNIITMYEAIHDVLVDLGDDPAYKDDWTKIHFVTGAFENIEFVFFAHLMYIILGYTNELSECLQRRDQDILNAISLVNVAKKRMEELRYDGWDNFLEKVTSFCDKHGVEVSAMDGDYVPYGKSARKAHAQKQTNDDHFRREVYVGVIDQISQELDNRFDEINMELLSYYDTCGKLVAECNLFDTLH